ncbi:MAG: hypothetical protein HZB30_02845 [Nitrospirae bacterium]|nr:hypothetical protein [Nitrospirota bacterium]
MRKRKTIALLLSAFSILIVSAFIDRFDAVADISTVKATGTLTSIEDDGRVIIDEKGYEVDPSVMVINRKGKIVSLRSLSLPATVRFEYTYAKTGFIIVMIEEVKSKEVKNKRSPR